MIIWSGWGFLVPFIGLACALLTELMAESVTGDNHYYQQHRWLVLVAMLLAAFFTYGLHLLLLRKKGRVVIDKETGEEIVLGRSHTLFFIPVKWWSVIFVIIGIVIAFTKGEQ